MGISKIIYTNGILTDPQEAAKTAEQLNQLTGIDAEAVHNGSTSYEIAGTIGIHLVEGIVRLGWYALNSDDTKMRDQGLKSLKKAAHVWLTVQDKKVDCAKTLVGRVQAFLDQDKSREILLVFHSQGAHVGLKALRELKEYKGRIHVVVMGGMVRIPEKMAKTVVNFAHNDDPVSNYVTPIVGPHGNEIVIGSGGHEASSYLENPSLIDYLLSNRIIKKAPALCQSRVVPLIANQPLPIQVC